ncbi:bifunctional non-homologous end joining protein LigD [Agromyces flavus]|uniref:DNA ligase (ATP) n=1 Tax=Agromyces flavus TaxID=589382 RepID=A0A1H1Y2H6_9MICO|nr:ATP-dependent DNA ligase [Agromyces flavus]MCP2366571.1 bifunctional non-homologous end joining protein LigD [Agromyces flavus]GGI44940.1 ATP-dependent DNA ligase [Agromyces flavus]SDT15645.1 ATP-dependent DNA ligase LigD ligase module /ATP-dependent DNA ligase LigD phosphoesterase module /ATP-dependent DNA ligase LigD polymerase module [Agromyces flavus]
MAQGPYQLVDVDGRRLRLTSLDKVMYPETGMTKGEMIAYYAEIAPTMLPHVAGRAITRKRWVNGVGTPDHPAQAFFEKNLEEHAPEWIRRGVQHHSDGDKSYPIADSRATLVWLAQMGAIELHVPQWRFDPSGEPANPDRMVFDLDPGPGMGLAECAEVARLVRAILQHMGLEAVPVTSGSKGLQLYAALDGSQTSEQVSAVAHELAKALEADHPDLIVSNMRKSLREGRILIDWSQNNANKTTIAPYSLRGRFRPTVAAPRTWDELDDPDLRHLEADEVVALVAERGDPMLAVTAASAEGPLSTYLSMRTAGSTPEPMPESPWGVANDGDPRFVIQEHHARRLHYDLRLERDGVLKSWAVPKGVPETADRNNLAVQTEDHPMQYLVFEGTIPEGQYGAGGMTVWDTGTYETEKWRDDEVIFTLTGRVGGPLGRVRLALIRTQGQGEKSQWLLHRMKEQHHAEAGDGRADAAGGGSDEPPWAASRPSRSRARRGPTPSDISSPDSDDHPPAAAIELSPMLAVPGTAALAAGADWALEWKWDGIRLLARVDDGAVRLVSRKGIDQTATYPDLAGIARVLRADAVVDGEVVALDERGRPDFGLLQQRMNLTKPREIAAAAKAVPVVLHLFDVLEVAGTPTLDEPYTRRRERLERLFRARDDVPVDVPPVVDGDPDAALDEARRLGLEGVVAKRRRSTYRPGVRSDDWVKLKLTRTQEVVIGGYRKGVGAREGRIRSLLVGIPDSGGLRYAGRVGSGLRERDAERLLARLDELHEAAAPFHDVPATDVVDAVWVRPELVGEIEFGEWTRTGVARHPRWRGLRPDKRPDDVVLET